MAGFVHGVASWPGATAIEGCTYTCSHGISPGVAILRMSPQASPPDEFGDLVITDGNEDVVIPNAKVQAIKVDRDDRGFFWNVEIADRRWRWANFGYINGCFNQFTPIGAKLIPWTIRSPTELAVLCLTAMGETNYVLQLPPGINYPGPFYPFPVINVSGVNPPVDWYGVPPAQTLQQIADKFGCRIIYQLSRDRILIAPVGAGAALPPGSIAKSLPSLTPPLAPSGVGVIGSPTRYQVRLALTPVGEEWDGSYLPINLLSYAPKPANAAGQVQISKIVIKNSYVGVDWKVTLTKKNAKGDAVDTTVAYTSTDGNLTNDYNGIQAAMNAATLQGKDNPFQEVTPIVNVVGGSVVSLTVRGSRVGVAFDISVSLFYAGDQKPLPVISCTLVQPAMPATKFGSWEQCWPPEFQGVQQTNRLTVADAQRLAQKSVWRCYQLTGIDVSGNGPPNVPGYGPVLRTMQLILQDTQVDQIVPSPDNANVLMSNQTIVPPDANNQKNVLTPLTVNFYNGYSQDKPAAVFGQIFMGAVENLVWYPKAQDQLNTPAGSQVHVPFSVEPELYLIRFGAPVFFFDPAGTIRMPNLTLQTAVMVRDPSNNQLTAFTRIRPLPGGDPDTPPAMRNYPDVQANVTSAYDNNNRLLAWTLLEADPIVRAEHYLDGMVNEYQYKPGLTVEYNGIRAIDLDGLTWQVTWTVDGEGCSTTVTQNGEHSIWIPPYRARRRAEYLPPVTEINKAGERVNMVAPARGMMLGPPGGIP